MTASAKCILMLNFREYLYQKERGYLFNRQAEVSDILHRKCIYMYNVE